MSSKSLDVYRDWLGIKETARPLNHYQLLRLPQFEDDPSKVRKHYRQMNAHVRKFATGEFASQSQALLNELAKAMLCLTDARRKAEYDASLGREEPTDDRRRTMEEILIRRKVVAPEQLDKARNLAKSVGIEIRDAVLQQKLAKADDVMQAYAESLGLPYVELSDVGIDEELVPTVPAVIARQNSCAPVMVDDGQVIMASPNPLAPEVEDNLRLRFGMPVRTALCTPASMNEVIAKYYPKELAAAQLSTAPPRTAGEGGAAAAATPSNELSYEELQARKKQRGRVALIVGNFTVMAFFVVGTLAGLNYDLGSALFYPSGIVAGAIVGGLTYLLYNPK